MFISSFYIIFKTPAWFGLFYSQALLKERGAEGKGRQDLGHISEENKRKEGGGLIVLLKVLPNIAYVLLEKPRFAEVPYDLQWVHFLE